MHSANSQFDFYISLIFKNEKKNICLNFSINVGGVSAANFVHKMFFDAAHPKGDHRL
jgi:hypothetical protein